MEVEKRSVQVLKMKKKRFELKTTRTHILTQTKTGYLILSFLHPWTTKPQTKRKTKLTLTFTLQ